METPRNRLNPHKATGSDSIPGRLLKETAKEITPALTFIFKAFINQGKIPSDWKTAIVAPVFKKGDRGQPSNYRPISLTWKSSTEQFRRQDTKNAERG
jgi:hypothetical protein